MEYFGKMLLSLFFVSSLVLLKGVESTTCNDPQVTLTSTFTTEDGTVITNVAFVAAFNLKCSNGVTDVPLYAEVNGRTFPVVHHGKEDYQVSWTEELSKSKSGSYTVRLYDEEGYVSLRKAMRNSESTSSVKSLSTFDVTHPGTYQGPWLNSEFLAVVVATVVWYFAFSAKSKLLH